MMQSDSDQTPAHPVVPRKILRQLILGASSILPSRILDLGRNHQEMAAFLELLGFEAVGSELPPAGGLPPLPCFHSEADGAELFDLILLRDGDCVFDNLLSGPALRQTAELLACLSPGGTLAVLSQHREGAEPTNPHSSECLRWHLNGWPGTTSTTVFSEGFPGPQPWKRLIGSLPRADYCCGTLTIPRRAISRAEWLDVAESLAERAAGTCCGLASRESGETRSRFAA